MKRRVAPQALERLKDRVRQITRRSGGRSLAVVCEELGTYLAGWKGYFRIAETPGVMDDIDKWVRHRLRALQLKHWKRGTTMYRELKALGASEIVARRVAGNACGYWRNADRLLKTVLTIAYFDRLRVPRLS